MTRPIETARKTAETDITLSLDLSRAEPPVIRTGMPFFDHVLHSMAFHGGFYLSVKAAGDLDVDSHHLVEDVGIVLGQALKKTVETYGPVERFAEARIVMDEALSSVVADMGGRPFLVFDAAFPQPSCGGFDTALVREFLYALAVNSGLCLHAQCEYGDNSHHMVEALFKALGIAIGRALRRNEGRIRSTKGVL